MKRIGVIGGGAWGTALAIAAQRAGNDVTLWVREPELADAINIKRENTAYLPKIPIPTGIAATSVLPEAVDADAVLLVPPAQKLREVCAGLKDHWKEGVAGIICSKGIEQGSCALMSDALKDALPQAVPAILSGPTFAAEVGRGLPSAATLACEDETIGMKLVKMLSSPFFRLYWSGDVVGAQIGGAVKNVLAIACGIVTGKGMGDNTRAALITRGLAELTRFGLAMDKGVQPETLMGLSGLGDLTLTCNAMQSRNFSLGVALGKGQSLNEILESRNSISEGVYSAVSVMDLADKLGVELPICEAVYRILHKGEGIDPVTKELLSRPLKAEVTF